MSTITLHCCTNVLYNVQYIVQYSTLHSAVQSTSTSFVKQYWYTKGFESGRAQINIYTFVVNAKALSIMRYQDDINTEHNMKSICRPAVAQWTKRLTRNGQTRVRIRKAHIFDITHFIRNPKNVGGGMCPPGHYARTPMEPGGSNTTRDLLTSWVATIRGRLWPTEMHKHNNSTRVQLRNSNNKTEYKVIWTKTNWCR